MSQNRHVVEFCEPTLETARLLAMIHGEAFVAADAWDPAAFMGALAQPGAFACVVVQDDDEPLGFVLLRAATFLGGGGEAEVLTLATRPLARRRGVAGEAMAAAITRARAMDVDRVFLEVAVDNAAACALYTRLGFAEVGRRKGYYARTSNEAVDAVVMALDL